jgi:hypothetical protein
VIPFQYWVKGQDEQSKEENRDRCDEDVGEFTGDDMTQTHHGWQDDERLRGHTHQ